MYKIFINIASYNEEDLSQTVETAFEKAAFPENINFGISMQYTNGIFPNFDKYKNVKCIKINEEIGLGLGISRGLAASFYNDEDYYLQIDAHTIFKKNWDEILIKNHNELKKHYEKPIITTYAPLWYRDKTNNIFGQGGIKDFETYLQPGNIIDKLKIKDSYKNVDDFYNIVYGAEALNSPNHINADFSNSNYIEHFLCSGHFLFADGNFIKEIPHDEKLAYHEENVTALRAWTRGYRMFTIKDHVLWTREAYYGNDSILSWRKELDKSDISGDTFRNRITIGSLRNKQILTGEILGIWGALNNDKLKEYEAKSGIDYKDFYKKMYEEVEKNPNRYYAAQLLYNLDINK